MKQQCIVIEASRITRDKKMLRGHRRFLLTDAHSLVVETVANQAAGTFITLYDVIIIDVITHATSIVRHVAAWKSAKEYICRRG